MELSRSRRPLAQRGAILIYTLIALLLIFLGALFALRGGLTDTTLTDRFSERQKNTQASDLALQWIASQIATTAGNTPLEISAQNQTWFLDVSTVTPAAPASGASSASVPTAPVAPSASYWATCMKAPTASDTCAQATLSSAAAASSPITQTAWVFVQPTGRTDSSACNTQGLTAVYYDIWVHTLDARQQVATDTEAVYKLCVR